MSERKAREARVAARLGAAAPENVEAAAREELARRNMARARRRNEDAVRAELGNGSLADKALAMSRAERRRFVREHKRGRKS